MPDYTVKIGDFTFTHAEWVRLEAIMKEIKDRQSPSKTLEEFDSVNNWISSKINLGEGDSRGYIDVEITKLRDRLKEHIKGVKAVEGKKKHNPLPPISRQPIDTIIAYVKQQTTKKAQLLRLVELLNNDEFDTSLNFQMKRFLDWWDIALGHNEGTLYNNYFSLNENQKYIQK